MGTDRNSGNQEQDKDYLQYNKSEFEPFEKKRRWGILKGDKEQSDFFTTNLPKEKAADWKEWRTLPSSVTYVNVWEISNGSSSSIISCCCFFACASRVWGGTDDAIGALFGALSGLLLLVMVKFVVLFALWWLLLWTRLDRAPCLLEFQCSEPSGYLFYTAPKVEVNIFVSFQRSQLLWRCYWYIGIISCLPTSLTATSKQVTWQGWQCW